MTKTIAALESAIAAEPRPKKQSKLDQIRELREKNAQAAPAPAPAKVCKIDHSAPGEMPKDLCRTCTPKKPSVAPAQAAPVPSTTNAEADAQIAAQEIKWTAQSPEEAEILFEADRLWRQWVPSARERSRPRKATFAKRIREERKAAAKLAAKLVASAEAKKKATQPASQEAAEPVESTVKTATKTKAKTAKKAAPSTERRKVTKAKASSGNARKPIKGRYDWEKAAAEAAKGHLPSMPPLAESTGHLGQLQTAAKAAKEKDKKTLREYAELKPTTHGRKVVSRFAALCLKALA